MESLKVVIFSQVLRDSIGRYVRLTVSVISLFLVFGQHQSKKV